jgi:GGDEF domain-containing protein
VFNSLVDKPYTAARIGGDEFALLLPGVDAAGGNAILASLNELVEINNQFYPDQTLSLSAGAATSHAGERLEAVVKRADLLMLEAKRAHYSDAVHDRRRTGAV